MQTISLEIIGDQVKVITPYHEEFVRKCRNLRGHYKESAWWFDDSILEYVREIMMESFGTTGETPFETCTLLIKDYDDREDKGPCTLFGRTIARAFGRDSGAKLGDDIIFISGIYTSSGSVKNWCTEIKKATFEIHHFPIPSIELPPIKKAISDGWCIVKYSSKKRDKKLIEDDIKNCEERLLALKQELNDL